MKLLPILFLLFASLASGSDYWSQRNLQIQQEHATREMIRDSKARSYNLKQLRAIPTGETYEEASRRRDDAWDEYFESLP